ncbi:MAG: hypothetical protein V8K32_11785 [Candidatus Electrothrix gigas]
MKSQFVVLLVLFVLMFFVPSAQAVNCDTDCGKEARFKYPCPTFSNPGRKCTGKNHARYAACETEKKVSCDLWNRAVNFFKPKVKPMLKGRYNAGTYANASDKNDYLVECTAAAVAALSAVGSSYGPPYGTLAGGAAGFFVGKRICIQSQKW